MERTTVENLKELIRAGRAKTPATKVIMGGTLVNVMSEEIYPADIAVYKDTIVAVGDVKEYIGEETEVIDAKGRYLVPGFIDAHSHFVGAANAMTQCDLSLCKDFGEIIELMKAFKEKRNLPGDAWIIGCNYDQNFLAEGRHPDKTVLDQISSENPVLLIHASSHMGVTNSRGLEGLRKRQRTVRVDVTEESQKRENRMVIWKRRHFWHSRKSFR